MPEVRHDFGEKRRAKAMKRAAVIVVTTIMLAASVGAQAASPFDAVQRLVSGRLHQRVEWNRGTPEDAEVECAVRSALRRKLTMDSAVQIALLNNRGLQAQFEEVGISQADLVQAGLLANPEFAASFRFPDRSPSGTNIEYSIAQDFLDLILRPLRRKLAAAQLEQTQLRVTDEVLKLASEVKIAFCTLQARQELLQRARALTDTNESAAELSRRLHDAGNLNDLDLASQQATYLQSRLEAAQLEALARSDREKLNRLLGAWGVETGWTIADKLPELPARDPAPGKLEALAISQRLDLQVARLQADLAGKAYALRARTRFFPASIKLGLDTERGPDRQVVTGPTLALQVPLFDQGQGAVGKLRAQYRQAIFRLQQLAIDTRSEVREARDQMAASREVARYSREILLPQRQQVTELTQQHYNYMLKGSFDLLLAKQNEIAAERSAIEACRDYWIARAQLERAVGGSLSVRSSAKETPANSKEMPGH
jgi:cobalt-zinc-cadmium efflux system outer membrane protein